MKDLFEWLNITPGPWKLNDEWDFDSFISGNTGKYENVICQPVQPYKKGLKTASPWEKNKTIIAAAPEILEALIGWCLYWDEHFESPPKFEHSIKIIEKATGRKWQDISHYLKENH